MSLGLTAQWWHFIFVSTQDPWRAGRHLQHSAFSKNSSVLFFFCVFKVVRKAMKFYCQVVFTSLLKGLVIWLCAWCLMCFRHVHLDIHLDSVTCLPGTSISPQPVVWRGLPVSWTLYLQIIPQPSWHTAPLFYDLLVCWIEKLDCIFCSLCPAEG